ncbi:DNA polymerase III subunit delta [Intestinibacter sp.]|uniref:DNA polymerase III subunit delta n=1 Tax=Intestinibacter sp. TaxID=1965304 RepID=UPI002A75BF7F|nr:DNA polymerase III subunit delta [Intestinibacter sp.]MDY2737726.1 DNA polymerase III subunit delta [Intestinibacter sp.]
MKYKDIVYNIKAKNFERIYLLYGREHYLIDNAIKLFKESLNESMIDFNLDILDGKEIMLDQLLSSIETLPFMDERKIVIVKDFELLMKGKKKNFSDKEEKIFAEHLENIPDTTVLVFAVYGDIDKKKSIVNKINKNGIVYNCEKISDMDLFKWTRRRFDENQITIENAQVMYFIESTGYKDKNNEFTLSDIENEIKKISSFAGKDTKVTNEIIDRLSQKKIENDIFKLIDYIGEKNSQNAIKILNDMINEGESVLGIFAMINRQFKIVLQVKALLNKGMNNKDIADKLKMSLFVVNKSIKISKNFTESMIIDMLNYILESDYKIKNGLMRDTLAIEMLVSQYCQKKVS